MNHRRPRTIHLSPAEVAVAFDLRMSLQEFARAKVDLLMEDRRDFWLSVVLAMTLRNLILFGVMSAALWLFGFSVWRHDVVWIVISLAVLYVSARWLKVTRP